MADDFLTSTPWIERKPTVYPAPPVTRSLAARSLSPAGRRHPSRASAAQHWSQIAFVLFLITNAVIFLRPTDWVPGVEQFPLYQILMILTLLAWLPTFHLTAAMKSPLGICVCLLLPAVVLSHLSHLNIFLARTNGPEFTKRLIYFLLIAGLINSPIRLRTFLRWITPCIVGLTVLGLLQYHGVIDYPALRAFQEWDKSDRIDPNTGAPMVLLRLCSVGIFNDPNDLCLILCFGFMLSLYWLHDGRQRGWKIRWLAFAAMFLWAIYCTHSRGGFLALIAAVVVFLACRFGIKKTLPACVLLIPLLLLLYSGRQTEISTSQETAQDRIHLWSDGLQMFKSAPAFGIGMNQFAERVNLVAHNSYLQCFTELGFFGGTLFLGAFVYAAWALYRLARLGPFMADDRLTRFRPYLLGSFAAYVIGYMSLSRAYIEPTYLMLGLVAVYLALAERQRPGAMPPMTWRLAGWGLCMGVAFVLGMYLFVRIFARWSA